MTPSPALGVSDGTVEDSYTIRWARRIQAQSAQVMTWFMARRGITEGKRLFQEQPLHLCGLATSVAVATNLLLQLWLGNELKPWVLAWKVAILLISLFSLGVTSDWQTVRDSSLVVKWIRTISR